LAYVLFAAPSIASYHLHDRLAELAARRGHRVAVLAVDPVARAFWLAQGLPVQTLNTTRTLPPLAHDLPLAELAEIDCRLAGHAGPTPAAQRRAEHQLRRHAGRLSVLWRDDPPDVVVMHEGRTGLHRLVHYLSRQHGIGVLHLGEGLLPGTLTVDQEGAAGDAALCRRAAADYRGTAADPAFLHAALAAWIGGATAPSAVRRTPSKPLLFDRVFAALGAMRAGPSAVHTALHAWRAAATPPLRAIRPAMPMPTPALAVLLQRDDCARVRLDAPPRLDPHTLLHTTRTAVDGIDRTIAVVGVLPKEPLGRQGRGLAELGCQIIPHHGAAAVLATALAVVTINDPLAGAALLHGTPVVHLGRAIYGVRGVAVASTRATLADGLRTALSKERPSLRERFLTRILRRDHVWCASDSPDRNGLHGLMATIERMLAERTPYGGRIVYRPGPVWPLAAIR
jgi:hypothetical protein